MNLIKPYFPNPNTNNGKKRVHSNIEILNAIFYLLRSGCVWRMLPQDFPPWKTVYYYFLIWRNNRVWKRINDVLRTELRIAYGREPEPSAGILDGQLVKKLKLQEYAAMMLLRKLKGESGTF